MIRDLARGRLRCGSCCGPIRAGEPVAYTRHRRMRCEACAKRHFDETPPADLHQAVAPPTPPAPPTFVRVTRTSLEHALPFDVKAARIGER